MKTIFTIFLSLHLTISFAQSKPKPEKLVTIFKLNHDTYIINERSIEIGLENPLYNADETGQEYVLYSKRGKSQKEEYTANPERRFFPRKVSFTYGQNVGRFMGFFVEHFFYSVGFFV